MVSGWPKISNKLFSFKLWNPENQMKIAKLAVMIVLLVPVVRAQQAPQSTATHQLTAMLNQFLNDASNGNSAGFERFFADDVIYTGSNGLVRTKPEIMK